MSIPPTSIASSHIRWAERRPFGTEFPAQRLNYLLYLPLILCLMGATAWLSPGNVTFVLGALVGGLVGLYVLMEIVFRGAPIRLTTTYGMTVLLGYNLGALNSWLTVKRATLTIAEKFARDPNALTRAIGACLIVAAILFTLGEIFERPIFGKDFYLRFGSGTPTLVVTSMLLILGAYATGRVNFMGVVTHEGHLDPISALIGCWFAPAFAYSVCATMNATGRARWVMAFATLVQAIALIPFGRIRFAFSLLLALIAIRLGRYRLRLPLAKAVLIGVLGIASVIIASVGFLYLRVAGWEQRGKLAPSIVSRISLAIDLAQRRGPLEILGMLGNDASSRTFVIGFLSDLLDASQRSAPLLGKDMLYNIGMAVPSVISPTKLGLTPYNEETLANQQWGFAYLDEANSLLTAGAADFGLIGMIVYPILIVGVMRMVLEWLQATLPTYLSTIIALAFLSAALQWENVPLNYLIEIRSGLLMAFVFYVLTRLPILGFSSSN
jgi:hypothetical protein